MNHVACQLEALAERHNVHQMTTKSRRTTLQPQHIPRFVVDDDIFCHFAKVVCTTKCIRRKELFEAWAMALYVQDCFPECRRFADLASGQGLLSWALLVLLGEEGGTRSAVCIDIKMPLATEKLQVAMEKRWPNLCGQWDFVEAKLEYLEPDSSTLLLGVHCCGILSDRIIDLAIRGNCPLALVPCCHSKKCLTPAQVQELECSPCNLTDYIDSGRVQRLKEAGFAVTEQLIPEIFTPKNRILLASPPPTPVLELPPSPM